jgi:MinD-like ATPase involved in chromosome partitioning or flagellar assembly
MFTAATINATPGRRQWVHAMAVDSSMLFVQWGTDAYPTLMDFERLCGPVAPDILLLDLTEPVEAQRCLAELQNRYPDTPIIGIGGTPYQQKSLQGGGIRHFVPFSSGLLEFQETVGHAIRSHNAAPLPHLFSILPAKAGCGSSTIALCTATLLAKELNKKVLCIDADLRSGVMSVMMDRTLRGSTQEALTVAAELDHFRWDACVTSHLGVDFLLSSGNPPNPLPDWTSYFALLRFVQWRYDTILVDLPEVVNGATEEVVRRSSSVFVVTTQEIVALKLAERRIAELVRWGVQEERIRIIVNRWHARDAAMKDVERFIGRPVAFTIPNDYPRLRAAMLHSQLPLPVNTPLGKVVLTIAQSLAGVRPIESGIPKAKIAGFFRTLVSRASL